MDYERLRELRNSTNPFARHLGLTITAIRDGEAEAELPVTSDYLNPGGSVHGGCLYTLADAVGGAAASSCGMHIATVDSSFHFLRAGLQTSRLTGRARAIKRGKRLLVYEVTVYDDQDSLLAQGIFTYMPLSRPIFPENAG